MVHQHFMLVPVFTVAENVILGAEPTGPGGFIKTSDARKAVEDISSRYGLRVDPDVLIEKLPVGLQQRVEIIKVLNREARYVIFDEPTAVLTPQEVEEFFKIVRELKEDGKGIIFITHKLGEALDVADRIVVMRAGKTVAEVDPAETNQQKLAELMVGRPVQLVVPKDTSNPAETVLVREELGGARRSRPSRPATGSASRCGLGKSSESPGCKATVRSELIEAIMGLRPSLAGEITMDGRDITDDSPRDLHEAKVSHIPEDRQESGLVLSFTVAENMVLNSYYEKPYSRGWFMDWDATDESAKRLVKEYDVRTPHVRPSGFQSLRRQPAESDRRS